MDTDKMCQQHNEDLLEKPTIEAHSHSDKLQHT